jgi:putative hydrolase of the HAD superfamily
MMAYMRGELSAGECWERFALRTGVAAPEDYWRTLFDPVIDPAMRTLIEDLRQGHRVVCGSNTIDSHYELLKARGAYDCFDEVYVSNLIGYAKPEAGFFRHILDSEGSDLSRVIFIDDMAENVQAARGLGMRAILYTGIGELKAELSEFVQ